jgi:hypothetical protein
MSEEASVGKKMEEGRFGARGEADQRERQKRLL